MNANTSGAAVRRHPGTGATQHAIETLTRVIRDGIYPAGQRLVEAQLTRELGVSRSSLREALRRLASDGLIELEPHRGAIVKRMERDDVIDILIVRESLEGLAAGLAAQRMHDAAARGTAQRMLDAVRAVPGDAEAFDYVEDNLGFHRGVVKLSGNKVLGQQIEQLQLPNIRARFFGNLPAAHWQRSLADHEGILEAILDGDAAFAEQLMRTHVRRSRRLFEQMPDASFDEA